MPTTVSELMHACVSGANNGTIYVMTNNKSIYFPADRHTVQFVTLNEQLVQNELKASLWRGLDNFEVIAKESD